MVFVAYGSVMDQVMSQVGNPAIEVVGHVYESSGSYAQSIWVRRKFVYLKNNYLVVHCFRLHTSISCTRHCASILWCVCAYVFWAAGGHRPAVADIPKIMPAMAGILKAMGGIACHGRHTYYARRSLLCLPWPISNERHRHSCATHGKIV